MKLIRKSIYNIEYYFISDNPEEICTSDRIWFYVPYSLATLITLAVTLF
ncbi:hypothetical protein [Bacillus sp. FJAT-22090]|nr:hypothetical protein [Bacillus sp. FJAT-22090]